MEILAAYDLTGSLQPTAEPTGCSHRTVARHVAAPNAGRPIGEPPARGRVTDAYLPKIDEWIEASKGRIRADKAHERLLALGYKGKERSTRRAIAQVKAAWRLGHVRVHRQTRRHADRGAARLHRIPDAAHTVTFGLSRTVPENRFRAVS